METSWILLPLVIVVMTEAVNTQYWMALGTQSINIDPSRKPAKRSFSHTRQCESKRLPLHEHQREVCRNFTDLIQSVASGARMSIDECQFQFRRRKWNCSIEQSDGTVFGNMIKKASRESGFINAITSAGVAYSVTEACAEGKSIHCRCDYSIRGRTAEGWNWGGCNRPISYGIWFSSLFIDKIEYLTRKKRNPRKQMNLHNNRSGRERGLMRDQPQREGREVRYIKRHPRKQMNLHNNRAGREVIRKNLWTKCKCHGMSGNCNLKTCWLAQPKFKKIGDVLKEKYDSAHEMVPYLKTKKNGRKKFMKLVPKYKEYQPPTPLDIIYYEESPDFCENDNKLGIQGTRGRECNLTSPGVDGCELMCCRRGYKAEIVPVVKQCNCKFIWCCKVQCQQCTVVVAKYTCK